MTRKRSVSELEAPPPRPRRENTKRAKTSPSDELRSNSSVPSSCSVSEASALRSSPPVSQHTRQSSISSLQSPDYDDGSESSLSSSDEESLSSGSEDEIINIGAPKKPAIHPDALLTGAQDLQARLAALLPQLAAANDSLEHEGGGHSMEDVGDGEQHIEMSLGLGVLEEKNGDGESSESGDSSDDEEEGLEEAEKDEPVSSGSVKRAGEASEANGMGKLLGRRKGRQKPGIEEMG